ncbi:hypothetical protein ACL02T_32515 [Pseudonocardia sp. RS010]|uniref:hypothetical protein n=1 Tax=Pseudonocardia sp. RS010 TaxID=3385979 RepID=UPI00399F2386
MGARPGRDDAEHGVLRLALATSTLHNSAAFGFSIAITGSFGVVQTVVGSPAVLTILVFAVSAAAALGLVEAVVTNGFRVRVKAVPAEVTMLATAQNLVSVALAILAVTGVAVLLRSWAAWPVGGATAALVYLFAESAEMVLAEVVQRRRGDPEAESEEG